MTLLLLNEVGFARGEETSRGVVINVSISQSRVGGTIRDGAARRAYAYTSDGDIDGPPRERYYNGAMERGMRAGHRKSGTRVTSR